MRILIAGGRVIDPANRRDAVLNLLIEGGRIVEVASTGTHSEISSKYCAKESTYRAKEPSISHSDPSASRQNGM